jgi:hypothetical protein
MRDAREIIYVSDGDDDGFDLKSQIRRSDEVWRLLAEIWL